MLGYQEILVYEDEYPVLGIPVRFRSNNQLVIDSVNFALGYWDKLPNELCERNTSYTVDLITRLPVDKAVPNQSLINHEITADTYSASFGGNQWSADRKMGKALALLMYDTEVKNGRVVAAIAESLALFLVNWSHRIPIHASAVSIRNHAIAFIGRSGAGKSCLAYACVRRGFDLLSEDTIYVGLESDYRFWGKVTKVHLLPETINLFPELVGRKTELRYGKLKIAVSLSDINCTQVLHAPTITVCLIEPNHKNQQSLLEPVSSEYVREVILSSLEPGFDLDLKRLNIGLDRLLCRNTYRLKVGYDLNATTDLLLNLV